MLSTPTTCGRGMRNEVVVAVDPASLKPQPWRFVATIFPIDLIHLCWRNVLLAQFLWRQMMPDVNIDAVAIGDAERTLSLAHHGTDTLVHGIEQMDAGRKGRIRSWYAANDARMLRLKQLRLKASVIGGALPAPRRDGFAHCTHGLECCLKRNIGVSGLFDDGWFRRRCLRYHLALWRRTNHAVRRQCGVRGWRMRGRKKAQREHLPSTLCGCHGVSLDGWSQHQQQQAEMARDHHQQDGGPTIRLVQIAAISRVSSHRRPPFGAAIGWTARRRSSSDVHVAEWRVKETVRVTERASRELAQ